MHPGWSGDFSYTYIRQLLHTARCHFTSHVFSEAPQILQKNKDAPPLFLRHDLKVSLSQALPVAEIEQEYGLRATFMVRSGSPLYSLNDRNSRIQLLELLQMGHEVGLHFDLENDEHVTLPFLRIVEKQMHQACDRIEQIICRPVRSFSLHRPVPRIFDGPLMVVGRVNADAQELRTCCLSDAGGNWQSGNPLAKLSRPGKAIWQVILHPIWWGEQHISPSDRLQDFFEYATREKSAREASRFDIELARTLPTVRRQAVHELVSGGSR